MLHTPKISGTLLIVYLLPLVTLPSPSEPWGRQVCMFPEPQRAEEVACDRVGKEFPCVIEVQHVVRHLCE